MTTKRRSQKPDKLEQARLGAMVTDPEFEEFFADVVETYTQGLSSLHHRQAVRELTGLVVLCEAVEALKQKAGM